MEAAAAERQSAPISETGKKQVPPPPPDRRGPIFFLALFVDAVFFSQPFFVQRRFGQWAKKEWRARGEREETLSTTIRRQMLRRGENGEKKFFLCKIGSCLYSVDAIKLAFVLQLAWVGPGGGGGGGSGAPEEEEEHREDKVGR